MIVTNAVWPERLSVTEASDREWLIGYWNRRRSVILTVRPCGSLKAR